jgi:hypothetical protein
LTLISEVLGSKSKETDEAAEEICLAPLVERRDEQQSGM